MRALLSIGLIGLTLTLCGCEEAEEWDCRCDAVCDGLSLDPIEIDNVCGPADADEAASEAVDGCGEGLVEEGCLEVTCSCTCTGQGPC